MRELQATYLSSSEAAAFAAAYNSAVAPRSGRLASVEEVAPTIYRVWLTL